MIPWRIAPQQNVFSGKKAPHGTKLHWAKRSTAQGTMIHWRSAPQQKGSRAQCSTWHKFTLSKRLHRTQSCPAHGTMPYNLHVEHCNAPHRIQWGFLSRPYSYNTGLLSPFLTWYWGALARVSSQDTGIPVPFPHRKQGFLSPFLTGYRDSCPPSSQKDTRVFALPSGLSPGVPVSFLAGYSSTCPFLAAYRVSSPHSLQDTWILYFFRLLTGYRVTVPFLNPLPSLIPFV